MTALPDGDLRWDLSIFYRGTDDPRIDADAAEALGRAEALAVRYRGKIAALDPRALRTLLGEYEALLALTWRPSAYASLRFSEDSNAPAHQALLDKTREDASRVSTALTFLDLEIKKAPEPVFAAWLAAGDLAVYRHYLTASRRYAPHTLSEAEEQLVQLKSLTGTSAWVQLYDETLASIRIPFAIDGRPREMTVDEVRALRSSPDRALRARAVRAVHEAHAARSHVLNFVFNTIFQDHKLETRLRHYDAPMTPRLLDDEIDGPVAEALMATTEAHYGLAQEYYALKARALGLTDFATHDLLAPLPSGERVVPFAEGRALVLESFREFSPEFAAIAQKLMDEGGLDLRPRPGKSGGAFCAAWLPELPPRVLLNYSERLADVATLAHELGHAIHFVLAGRAQNVLNYGPTTPMAETASVFAEILLSRKLLAAQRDPAARRALLAMQIEDILATVYRQVTYTRWEQKAHARRAAGVVTAEEYGALWRAEIGKLYGNAVALDAQDHWGWIGIPHFIHSRFYCYSYAFGQMLVLALYRRYLAEGPAFAPRYAELLAGGGSGTPAELLARVGIDLAAPAFWRQGFDTLREMIDEFRATVA